MLVGEIVRYETGMTEYGEAPIVVVANEDNGELLSVWLLHQVLLSEFQKLKPKPGERVGIKRLADDPERRYRRYAVRVDREDAGVPDLDRYSAGDVAPDHVEETVQRSRRAALQDEEDDLPF